jgi:polysaccharide biosynthesis protein PslG
MLIRRLFALTLTLVSTSVAGVRGQSLSAIPTEPIPAGFGVNIHFTDPAPGDLEMIHAAGFTWVRMDLAWGATERQKGHYDFSHYDTLLAALDRQHMRAMLILDYSNHFYDEGQSPYTNEGRDAFAKWSVAAVTHFKGRGILWEMYNEPNGGFWHPKPNAEDFARLSRVVGKAIRAAAPEETYIGPATSGIDMKFLETCFKAGCLEDWAAVSVHPYRQEDPETASGEYGKLRAMIAKYAPAGKTIPIISGEWGYSTAWQKFDEARQGKYLPRELLINLMENIPLSIWYDWHDDGPDPHEPEHHFGTVRNQRKTGDEPFEPKPAYLAARTLSTQLAGYRFDKRIVTQHGDDYILRFTRNEHARFAAWTRHKEPRPTTVPVPAGTYHVISHTGEPRPDVTADAAGLEIDLTDAPCYLIPVAAP